PRSRSVFRGLISCPTHLLSVFGTEQGLRWFCGSFPTGFRDGNRQTSRVTASRLEASEAVLGSGRPANPCRPSWFDFLERTGSEESFCPSQRPTFDLSHPLS